MVQAEGRVQHVGRFFDINVPGLLFRIEVATDALHFGVVPVDDLQKLTNIDGLMQLYPDLPRTLYLRKWRAFEWYSCLHKAYVASNMGYLLEPQPIIEDILLTVQQLTKLKPARLLGS